MRLTILALGSRGDVQPYVALGRGLKDAGYAVRVVTMENFEALVTVQGLDFHPVRGDAQALLQGAGGQELTESSGNVLQMWLGMMRSFGEITQDYIAAFSHDTLRDSDAILCQLPAGLFGYDLAEKLGIPYIALSVIPLEITSAWPMSMLNVPSLGGVFNRMTYRVAQQLAWQPFRGAVNQFRANLALPPANFWMGNMGRMAREKTPVIQGFSPHVVPSPPDWGDHIHTVGYWRLKDDVDWQPPDDLQAFLDRGAAPVFIGFGSMPVRDPARTTRIILDALEQSGQRAILSAGWAGFSDDDLPETVFVASYVPYPWLFPKMAAIIHHGGSGTTGLALWAGVPSMVVSFTADQPYWGSRVRDLGVGPESFPFKSLTADKLAYAIHTMVTNEPMRQRAADLGQKLQSEDGIASAVNLIQPIVGMSHT